MTLLERKPRLREVTVPAEVPRQMRRGAPTDGCIGLTAQLPVSGGREGQKSDHQPDSRWAVHRLKTGLLL